VRVGLSDETETTTERVRLTRGARWDLAGLFAAGAASSAFFLAPLCPAPPQPDVPPLQIAAGSPSPASVLAPAIEIASARIDAPRQSSQAHLSRSSVRATRNAARPQRITQSRWARLLVGDGTERVMPFPVPRAQASSESRSRP
jgi:hypothetical protein